MSEVWRRIAGASDYEVSDQGRVRSLKSGGLILKPRRHNGYLMVTLPVGGTSLHRFVHVLVLTAFVGPTPDGLQTRHLDGTRTNNHVENLAWGTRRENMADKHVHGTMNTGNSVKTHCKHGHPFDEENTYIRPGGAGRACLACKAMLKADYIKRRSIRRAAARALRQAAVAS